MNNSVYNLQCHSDHNIVYMISIIIIQIMNVHHINKCRTFESWITFFWATGITSPIVNAVSECYCPPILSAVSSGNSCNSIDAHPLTVADDANRFCSLNDDIQMQANFPFNDTWLIDTRIRRGGQEMNTNLGSYHDTHWYNHTISHLAYKKAIRYVYYNRFTFIIN